MAEEVYPYHEPSEPSKDGLVGMTALGLAGVMIVIMYSVMCWRHRSLVARTKRESLVVNNTTERRRRKRRRDGDGTELGSETGSESTSKSELCGVKKQDQIIQELISRELEKKGREDGERDIGNLVSVQEIEKLASVQDTANIDVTTSGREFIRTLSMNIPDTIVEESLTRVCYD